MNESKNIHPDMEILARARVAAAPDQSVEEARRNWTIYSSALSEPHPASMEVHDRTLTTAAGEVPVRIYRPDAAADGEGRQPAILYLHGGGFMKGDLDSSDSVAWGFAEAAGATVVSVDYRLTPEHPYPAAFDDCYGVLTWVAANGAEIGIDAARIAVAGDSAGGNLGAALALAARDRGGPAICAQALIYPGTGLDQDAGSYIENAEAPGLSTAGTKKYRDWYLPGMQDTDDPYARPVMAKDLSNLPPAHIHTAQYDPIRDDGRVYAGLLIAAGCQVTYREAKGMVHGFMRARFEGPAAAAEYALICDFLKTELS